MRLGTLRTRTTSAVWVMWDDDEEPTRYTQGDARYKVDTDLWRISSPRSAGDPLSALALTPSTGSERIDEQPVTEPVAPTEERVMPEASEKTYGAKQVATRIGTDARTFRKFLRSSASPVSAVGQGKRYDFAESDLPRIAKAFNKWKDGDSKPSKTSRGQSSKAEPATVEEADGVELDDEPSMDELEDLELELEDGEDSDGEQED